MKNNRFKTQLPRHAATTVIAFCVSVGLAGCGEQSVSDEPQEVTAEDVTRESKEAVKTTGQYLDTKRDVVMNELQVQMKMLEAQIASLRDKAAEQGEQAKQHFEEVKKDLDAKLDTAKEKFDELNDAGADAWAEASEGASAAMVDLRSAYTRALRHFQENTQEDEESAEQ